MSNFDVALFAIEACVIVTYWVWLSYKSKKELQELDKRLKDMV